MQTTLTNGRTQTEEQKMCSASSPAFLPLLFGATAAFSTSLAWPSHLTDAPYIDGLSKASAQGPHGCLALGLHLGLAQACPPTLLTRPALIDSAKRLLRARTAAWPSACLTAKQMDCSLDAWLIMMMLMLASRTVEKMVLAMPGTPTMPVPCRCRHELGGLWCQRVRFCVCHERDCAGPARSK